MSEFKTYFSTFIFFIQDSSLNMALILFKLYKYIDNIHLEGTVSQNFDIGPSVIFMSKNGKIFLFFIIIIS